MSVDVAFHANVTAIHLFSLLFANQLLAPQPRSRTGACRPGKPREGHFRGTARVEHAARAGIAGRRLNSSSQSKPLNELLISLGASPLEVAQKLAAIPDHHQQTSARGEVLAVGLEVLGQVPNVLGQQGNLNLG
jgi:hypothetical protein